MPPSPFELKYSLLLSELGVAAVAAGSYLALQQEVGGTIAYMAPEQIDDRACPASDRYALGIVVNIKGKRNAYRYPRL